MSSRAGGDGAVAELVAAAARRLWSRVPELAGEVRGRPRDPAAG